MDFSRLCLISLSLVCASQQLAVHDRRGPGRQDILGYLRVEKVLLVMHRFMDVEASKDTI